VIYVGLDEVGTGALAGPFCVTAVAMTLEIPFNQLTTFWPIAEVRDSKKTTRPERERLEPSLISYLVENEGEVGFGLASVRDINELGHGRALHEAQKRAVLAAVESLQPDMLLITDGKTKVGGLGPEVAIPRADSKYWLVAAASILAKLRRDEVMLRAHKRWGQYGWDRNMGYGTKEHRAAIAEYGACEFHRQKACRTVLRRDDAKTGGRGRRAFRR